MGFVVVVVVRRGRQGSLAGRRPGRVRPGLVGMVAVVVRVVFHCFLLESRPADDRSGGRRTYLGGDQAVSSRCDSIMDRYMIRGSGNNQS